jgi:hypothetical protein
MGRPESRSTESIDFGSAPAPEKLMLNGPVKKYGPAGRSRDKTRDG